MNNSDAKNDFRHDLARDLSYLYDPATLRRSPLLDRLGLAGRADAPAALQRRLTEAIEALQPAADTPPTTNAWRLYQILRYRYLEGMTQEEVAGDLALSTRHLRRLEGDAVDLLADALWVYARDVEPAPGVGDDAMPGPAAELAWLSKSLPTGADPVDAAQLVRGVLETIQPLLEGQAVAVACHVAEDMPPLAAPAMAVRQALLHTLTTAARHAPAGSVRVTCHVDAASPRARITVEAQAGRAPGDPVSADLEMIRQLVAIAGGTVDVRDDPTGARSFVAELAFPILEQIPVLVVDDNADTLGLLGRYLTGTRYRFLGTTDPAEVIALCERDQPRVIVVDVMLPEIDGWDLLGRLRSHPATQSTPVIVCSILAEEPLALALGAAAFLRKPVSRATLLAALEREAGSGEASR